MSARLRRDYQDGLDDLRLQVEFMGIKVEQNLERMAMVLEGGDSQLAWSALDADDDIDATNVSITEKCYETLLRQAPVAGDLRFVVSVVRVAAELERIGDIALRVVKLAPDHELLRSNPEIFDILQVMAARSIEVYHTAMSAWASADAATAGKLLTDRSPTAHLADRVSGYISSLTGQDAAAVAVRVNVACHALDRIADHALVIAARVRYLVTGDAKHLAAEVR